MLSTREVTSAPNMADYDADISSTLVNSTSANEKSQCLKLHLEFSDVLNATKGFEGPVLLTKNYNYEFSF